MDSIRYIFGCNHKNRTIFYNTLFERELVIPVACCKDCFEISEDHTFEK
jgi:hypothetical protein